MPRAIQAPINPYVPQAMTGDEVEENHRGVRPGAAQGQKPLSVLITAGQRGDSPQFEPDLDATRVPRIG
ncbi:hypothetical protein ACF08N_23245 [Streptomyces sp. NPDC015127]|uniref:hypothetical protein n=1 Tax=Streptomyces sp. NPDC015127 TaxID=3364939 RepID=UPI0036FF2495